MAGLPRQFPQLAIHLTDQARTPIITSSATEDPNQQHDPSRATEAIEAIDNHAVSPRSQAVGPHISPRPTRRQRAQALDNLTATALRARDTAARLGLGADLPTPGGQDLDGTAASTSALLAALGMTPPEHLVVTYNTGAVVIESFLDHRGSSSSGASGRDGLDNFGGLDGLDGGDNGESRVPLLVGVVAAPDAHSLRDARRATVRLERIGRQVQQGLVAQQHQR